MLAMRKLGKKGRFANQLLQYAYLRIQSGDDYQCPPWIGQELFGLQDPPVTNGTPELTYKFSLNAGFYAPYKDKIREWFTPADSKKYYSDISDNAIENGYTLIGLHLRRGDYGTFKRKSARWCFVAPVEWYLEWLEENTERFDKPILVIATDEPELRKEFSDYRVIENGPATDCYYDFYALTRCDVLLISNSTFGFAASMLNTRAKEFYRPRLSLKKLVPYNPWSDPLVLRDERY